MQSILGQNRQFQSGFCSLKNLQRTRRSILFSSIPNPKKLEFKEKQLTRSTTQLQEFFATTSSPKTLSSTAKSVKLHLETCPRPLDLAVADRVVQRSLLNEPALHVSSSTGKEIARLRDTYTQSVFLFHGDEETVCYKLLLAKCQPTTLVWLRLVPHHFSPSALSDRTKVWTGQQCVPPTFCWSYDLCDIVVVDPFLAADIASVEICMTSKFVGHGVLVTYDDCCPMLEIHTALRRTLPARKSSERASGGNRKRQKRHENQSQHESSSSASSVHSDAGSEEHCTPETCAESEGSASELDEDEKVWSKAYTALEEERETIRVEEVQPHEWFRFDLMGGAWNISRSGKVAYGPRVSAKSHTAAAAFLKTFNCANSASFEHATYGEDVTHKLAGLWREEVSRKTVFWLREGSPSVWPADKYTSLPYPADLHVDVGLLNARALARYKKIVAMPLSPSETNL
eukprot:6460686-Amphidinium_carterae.4